MYGHEEVVDVLVEEFHVKPDAVNKVQILHSANDRISSYCIQNGIQPVHNACYKGYEKVLRLLVEIHGASPTAKLRASYIIIDENHFDRTFH